jgi:hypothetical protein
VVRVNVSDQRLELVFGALRGEIGDLGLERTDQIGGRVDDRTAKFENGIVTVGQMGRHAIWVRI